KRELLLTTPKRKEILKDGAPGSTRCQLLGRGAYGAVFKAIYRGKLNRFIYFHNLIIFNADRSVAVKIIRSQAASSLQNESHLLNLKHRNIVRLLKLEAAVKFGLLIMEFPRGQSLQKIVDILELPLIHRVLITLDIVAALRHCHSHNVLHLDVKPTNILVALGARPSVAGCRLKHRRSYICKLCDFGSSMEIGENCLRGSPRGTLRYMSPEALRATVLSAASDMYSLGITMWQLQSRSFPYQSLDCNETIAYQVVKHELRPDSYVELKDIALNSPAKDDESYAAHRRENARRNLSFDPSYTAGRDLKKRRRQNRLALHFEGPAPEARTSACLENAYTKLYKSCWVSAPESRSSSGQIKNELQLML
ncbi:hypothetical protein KR026_011867, partial [Drosophila bipectinata]